MAVPLKKKPVLHPTHKCASAQKNKKLSAGGPLVSSAAPLCSHQRSRRSSLRAGQSSFTWAYVNYYEMSWWNTTKPPVIDIKYDKVFECFWGKRRVLRRISSVMWLINESSASHSFSWFVEKWVLCCHPDKQGNRGRKRLLAWIIINSHIFKLYYGNQAGIYSIDLIHLVVIDK